MNARTIKESRVLAPTAAALLLGALAIRVLPGTNSDLFISTITFVFAVCSSLMAASVFGNEFHWRTMPALLSQPLERRTIWFEKMRLLALGLSLSAVVSILCVLTYPNDLPPGHIDGWLLGFLIITLCNFCATPWLTLLCRNTFGAAALSYALPFAIWSIISILLWLVSYVAPEVSSSIETFADAHHRWVGFCALALFCGSTYRLGYTRFLKLQALDQQPREIQLHAGLQAILNRIFRPVIPRYSGPVSSLFRKELQLQRVSYWIAGGLTLCAILELLIGGLHRSEYLIGFYYANPFILLLIVPFITTAVAVAEERNWGVLGAQLTLPVPPFKQWCVKVSVVLFTNLLLSVLLPWLLGMAGNFVLHGTSAILLPPMSGATDFLANIIWMLGALLFIGAILFMSTISTTSLRAMLFSIFLFCINGMAVSFVLKIVSNRFMAWMAVREHADALFAFLRRMLHANAQNLDYRINLLSLSACACVFALSAAIIYALSYLNYRNGELNNRRMWTHGILVVFITVAASTIGFLSLSFQAFGSAFRTL